MIRLYDYYRSSAAYRLRIALNLFELDYESVAVDLLKGDHKSAENLARNPQGLVPSLEIDGQMLTQSLAILDYLEETRGPLLLPAQALERAQVRQIAHAIAVDIHPVLNLSVAKFASEASESTMKDWMHAFMPARLAAVETMLQAQPGPYCAGAKVTLADICLMPQLYNARRWEVDLSALSRITEIEAALGQIPAFARAHPDKIGAPT